MIRVLLVDDHPSVRAGLHAVLRLEPGLVPVGEAASAADALEAADALYPDVVVADYHLPDEDGLAMCSRLKVAQPARRVLIFSAYAGSGLVVPALVAGADGLLHKGAPAEQLFDAVRRVYHGQRVFPRVKPEQLHVAAHRIAEEDIPILGMLVERVSHDEIGATLGIEPVEVESRVLGMLRRLQVRTAVPM